MEREQELAIIRRAYAKQILAQAQVARSLSPCTSHNGGVVAGAGTDMHDMFAGLDCGARDPYCVA
jgi:hypothetical protein